MANKTVIDYIREDYPEFNPLEAACEKAKIPIELVRHAKNRVYYDGYYGPFSQKDWAGEQPDDPIRHIMTVEKAIGILYDVADAIEDYVHTSLEYCDDYLEDEDSCTTCKDEGGHDCEDGRTDSWEIANALFPFVKEIYGDGISRFGSRGENDYSDIMKVWEHKDKGVEAALATINRKPVEVD